MAIIRFQFVNLLTTWLISNTLYDKNSSLMRNQTIYLKGILMVYYPYATEKGKAELEKLLIKIG